MSMRRYVDWLREAEDDLAAAEDLLRLGRYSKACFFAQQAAEKALKALLMKRAGLFARTHSVVELLRLAREHGIPVPEGLGRAAERLDRFYVPTRYPSVWPSGAPFEHYDEGDAREAIGHAREVLAFARAEIEGAAR